LINIHDFDAYCFDLDGTIYNDNKLLPSVKEAIQLLRKHEKKILFITNTTIQTREMCQNQLRSLGIIAHIDEILTASYIFSLYFSE